MGQIELTMPYDPQVLAGVAANAREQNAVEAGHTVEWLLSFASEEAMTACLRRIWAESALPLRELADEITRVFACVDDRFSGLYLGVRFARGDLHDIYQQAPFPPESFDTLVKQLPCALPPILQQVALTCPDLTVGETGVIAAPSWFHHPLEGVRRWLQMRTFRDGECEPALVDALRRLVIEVAGDGLGNCFVLDRDGRLWFFDHEECEFRPCRVSSEDLIETYFTWPECVFDNDFLGLGESPSP